MNRPVTKRLRVIHLLVDIISIGIIMEITFRLESATQYSGLFKLIRLFAVFGGYFLALEYFTGRTVGKLLTGTKAVRQDNTKITFKDAITRTFYRYLPFDLLLPLMGADVPVWHDSKSNTKAAIHTLAFSPPEPYMFATFCG
jgi:uncharacterized RDD family membrane protein YckC